VIRTSHRKPARYWYSNSVCLSVCPSRSAILCCMDGKTIQCLPNPSQHVPIYIQYFPSYAMFKSMRKSKNPNILPHFGFPWGLPGAITLNVVWMEREFDAYKLSRCMCPSNYNCFWNRARYWSKIVIFHTPLAFDVPGNSATPFGMEKLEWCLYPMVKKFRRYLHSFWRNSRTWQTDRQTDRQTPHAGIYRPYA